MKMKDYNAVNKLEMIEMYEHSQMKLSSICIGLGISGKEARELSPDHLMILARGIADGICKENIK